MSNSLGEFGLQTRSSVRSDIQALRGLAILLVLLHHAHLIPALKAGYLGVDIFFVVSGYLITGIVQRGIESGNFSFRQFYLRRAKRLLPAAYVTFLATTLLAVLFLTRQEMQDYTWQLIGAVTFTGNIVLWTQTGYFEGAAALKPLLHVWSLSIEEQYYLLLPATLVFTPRRYWKIGAFLVVVISLALCLSLISTKPGATFYLLPTRAWELALGSLGALALDKSEHGVWLKNAYWPAILVLVLIPFFPVGGGHPGYDAILVCTATLVVILRRSVYFDKAMPTRMLAWFGDISYSLYLVHWPILAFAATAWVSPVPAIARLALAVLAVVLAWLVYQGIERPTRHAALPYGRKFLTFAAGSSAAVVLMGLGLNYADSTRNNTDFAYARRANHGLSDACEFGAEFSPKPQCRNAENPQILIWGDSFAMHMVGGLVATTSKGVVQATKSTCGPFLSISAYDLEGFYNRKWAEECISFNDSVIEYLKKTPSIEVVVLSSTYDRYLIGNQLIRKSAASQDFVVLHGSNQIADTALRSTISSVRAMGKKVVLIAPPPSSGFNIGRCNELKSNGKLFIGADYPSCDISEERYHKYRAAVLSFLGKAPTDLDVSVVRIDDFLCRNGICSVDLNGIFLYRDEGHLSIEGSRQLGISMRLTEQLLVKAR